LEQSKNYIVALVVAGVTAFPVECELNLLCSIFSIDQETINQMKDNAIQPLFSWLYNVKIGITETNDKYPYLAYGFDWLAYAHLMIAALFVGPYRDPIKNKWVNVLLCINIPSCFHLWTNPFNSVLLDISGLLIRTLWHLAAIVVCSIDQTIRKGGRC
jgi:hypothetical protein